MSRNAAISLAIVLIASVGQIAFAQSPRYGANLPSDTGAIPTVPYDRRERANPQFGANLPTETGAIRTVPRDDRRGFADPRDNRRRFGRSHEAERARGRGAGPNHEYYRGDRLPADYRHRNYVVNDWRRHNLSAPPRGYEWVQSGGDYLLIAVATGIIAQILLDHR